MRAVSLIAGLIAVVSLPAYAQDIQRGRALYETQCATCHTERLHDRRTSKVRTMADLRAEVIRWSGQTKQRFATADIEDVVRFLDQTHYRLEK